MKLWLASTDSALVDRLFKFGVFEGVLTNPTMIASAGRPPVDVIRDLCAATPGAVFFQLRSTTSEKMKQDASKLLAKGWSNLGIKVPLTREGCAVLHWLREQRVALRLATCVPATAPLLLATALDVPWVTPVGSMLEKLGGPSKVALLTEMQSALDQQRSNTILIPSLATPAEMRTLSLVGIRAGFVWDRDVDLFLDNELVRQTVAGFDKAWEKLGSLGGADY
jgi:transaldolase